MVECGVPTLLSLSVDAPAWMYVPAMPGPVSHATMNSPRMSLPQWVEWKPSEDMPIYY